MKIKRIAPSPFIKDVLLTTVTSGLTILSTLIVMRLLAQGLGTDGFGAYSLARRFLAVVSPFSTFAIGVGLARFIAISKDNTERDGYLLSGLLIGVIPSFIVLVFGLIFKDRLTVLIFRYDVYASLFGATLFMIVGYSFYNVLYSYYRGLGKMVKANLWQLAVIAVGPLAITFKYAISKELDLIVFLMGVCFLSSSLPLIFYSLKAIFQNKQSLEIKPYLKELFNYSLPRVPGGLALTGIFSIGPFLATYFGSLKDAGYLVVGLSVFSVIDNAVIAFGIVALPKVTHLFKEGRGDFLEKRVTDIVSMILHMGMFATAQVFIWADEIILIWLGRQYMAAVPLMKVLLLALVPYLAYAMLRSIVDSIEVKAVNTHNLYYALLLTLTVSTGLGMIGLNLMGLAIGTTVGLAALGTFTVYYLSKVYKFDRGIFKIQESLFLNTAFIGIAAVIKYWLVSVLAGAALLSAMFFIEGALFLLYLATLWKLKVRWVLELENRFLIGSNAR